MYGLAYVLVPPVFELLQTELDRTLAPFMRGGDDKFPREKLTFDDATDALARLHQSKLRYNPDGTLTWLDSHKASAFDLRLSQLSQHMAACRLDAFEGTFAEIEPDFDAFVRRFTDQERDPTTSRYGRWLNPIGRWDWWELGGRFNGAITGERRPASSQQVISSGPNAGRAILGNLVEQFGGRVASERAEIEANVELVETLKLADDRNERRGLPTAVVLPIGCCADEDRWLDRMGWYEIKPGARALLGASTDADFSCLARAVYERFAGWAAAGVAYHF